MNPEIILSDFKDEKICFENETIKIKKVNDDYITITNIKLNKFVTVYMDSTKNLVDYEQTSISKNNKRKFICKITPNLKNIDLYFEKLSNKNKDIQTEKSCAEVKKLMIACILEAEFNKHGILFNKSGDGPNLYYIIDLIVGFNTETFSFSICSQSYKKFNELDLENLPIIFGSNFKNDFKITISQFNSLVEHIAELQKTYEKFTAYLSKI